VFDVRIQLRQAFVIAKKTLCIMKKKADYERPHSGPHRSDSRSRADRDAHHHDHDEFQLAGRRHHIHRHHHGRWIHHRQGHREDRRVREEGAQEAQERDDPEGRHHRQVRSNFIYLSRCMLPQHALWFLPFRIFNSLYNETKEVTYA